MIEIPIGVSNHHVHLTHDVIEKLFGKGYTLTVRRNLTQKDEYACEEVVNLKANGKIIEQGSHNELMKNGGEYEKMFTLQASNYEKEGVSDEN